MLGSNLNLYERLPLNRKNVALIQSMLNMLPLVEFCGLVGTIIVDEDGI